MRTDLRTGMGESGFSIGNDENSAEIEQMKRETCRSHNLVRKWDEGDREDEVRRAIRVVEATSED
jgi:hypothetical protein